MVGLDAWLLYWFGLLVGKLVWLGGIEWHWHLHGTGIGIGTIGIGVVYSFPMFLWNAILACNIVRWYLFGRRYRQAQSCPHLPIVIVVRMLQFQCTGAQSFFVPMVIL